ncbi:fimbriae-associated protein fap1 [Diplodia corticola]|uniref:Fimbriae-associated protein fap1 n=1 Tax=Diplodia corticola TaxID=236234 RepID=A0A1J9SEG5_9PEZI|nr:fimbriae-associated protein fap1 [Diplodia corticola]OJD37973.1 fimbriae-associated protein fap1 [Diplodia corticola]
MSCPPTTPRQAARRARYEEKFGVRPDESPTRMSRSASDSGQLTRVSSEHVLRPASSSWSMGLRGSASVPAFRARFDGGRSSSASATTNSLLSAPNAGNVNAGGPVHINGFNGPKKPSPTPSLKRDKIQRLIKEHGSPPGLRVTAGGRIVPHDMPALGSPQYPVNSNSCKMGEWTFAGARGTPMQRTTSQPPYLRRASDAVPPPVFEPMSRSNSSNTAVNTTIPAYAHGYNSGFMPLFFPGPQFAFAQAPTKSFNVPTPATNSTNNSTAKADTVELRKMLEKLHTDQRNLEREMVIREGNLTAEERQSMVEQKVQMVNESDRIRKDIKRLESGDSSGSGSSEQQRPAIPQPSGFVATQVGQQPALNPYIFSNGPAGFIPFAPGSQFPPPYMFPNVVPFQGFTSLDGTSTTPEGEGIVPAADKAAKKDTQEEGDKQEQQTKPAAHAPRRSHALEIKDPNKSSEQKVTSKRSALDPTSPAYTPQKKSKSEASHEDSSLVFVPPSPSPIASPYRDATFAAHFPWLCSNNAEDKKNGSTTRISPEHSVTSSAHRPSASSINTADFFPNNPQEHSSASYNVRKNMQARQVTPDRTQLPWTNVFTSPEEGHHLLRAPQVSPIDGPSVRADSALGTSQAEGFFARNTQLRVPQNASRPDTDDKVSSTGVRAWSRAESTRISVAPPSSMGQLDFRNKSVTFLLGFSAGLSGQPIQGTEDVDYMQGWAQGLLSAKQSNSRQPSESSASPVSEEQCQPRQRQFSEQRQSSFLHPESITYRRDDNMPLPTGYMQLSATPMHKGSSATLKAAPSSSQDFRPVAARFESMGTNRSIASSMGVGPATVPTTFRTVSAETDKTITEKIDSMVTAQQTPMTHRSGNEGDEMRASDRSSQSPSKLARVFSGQSVASQGQQKLNRSFNLNCLGDQREQARHSRTSYDGAGDGEDEAGNTQTSETMNARVSPSKASAFIDSPSVSTGSPKKLSKAAMKNKFEEVAGNAAGAGKSKKGGKNKKPGNYEADDPGKMSRDEKKNWKEMWKRRFEDIRNEEQREIDRYRAQNPLQP